MIDAVIFDFDGVIRQWDEPALWTYETDAGFELGTVFEVAFRSDVHGPVVTGSATWDDWRRTVTAELVATHGPAITPVAARFFEFEGRLDLEMIALVESLTAHVQVGVLTNNHDRFEAYLEAQGLQEVFHAVANTHHLGVAKPDRQAYLAAAELLGAAPERCLFTDDLEHNVHGARDAGLHAHHFDGRTGLERTMIDLSIRW